MERHPRHIGIILDGNRRYAKQRGLPSLEGHRKGFDKLKELAQWCKDLDIKELTLYCFSMQNFNRNPDEVSYLMDLFEKAGNEFADDPGIHKNKVRIRAIGRTHLFPARVQKALARVQEATQTYDSYRINLALAYGGREEIVDAVKKIVHAAKTNGVSPETVTEEFLGEHLYLNSNPDMIIRTGGDQRTSNFLPWQSVYSEWFFLPTTWPEFSKELLVKIIDEFKQRERRFGK